MHATRRDRLQDRLAGAGLAALLVTSRANVRYLSGFTGSVGALLVPATGPALLAVDDRYDEQAGEEATDLPRVVTRTDAWLGDATPPGRLGVEADALPWARARSLAELVAAEVVAATGHVEALRACKDATELDTLRRACAATDAAFADLCEWLRPGLTERSVARRLEHALTTHGAHDRAFEAIVASGPNAARPHHRAGDRTLAAGDVVKVDFGGLVGGYHADMTRVLALGDPPAELAAVHAVVLAANRAGVAAATAGAPAAAVDAATREVVTAAGYGERFPHGTGHGVGLEIHEAPSLRADADGTLQAGMTVTVEPGVYLPGLGGVRIEDTVAVTAGDADVLTRSPRTLVRL